MLANFLSLKINPHVIFLHTRNSISHVSCKGISLQAGLLLPKLIRATSRFPMRLKLKCGVLSQSSFLVIRRGLRKIGLMSNPLILNALAMLGNRLNIPKRLILHNKYKDTVHALTDTKCDISVGRAAILTISAWIYSNETMYCYLMLILL